MQNSLSHRWSMLFIAVFSIAIYANTLQNGFLYDDAYTVVNNRFIKSLNNLPQLLTKDYFVLSTETTYRPMVTLTYFIDHAVYGLKPWGFHLTNIMIHAANGILLYIFLALLLKGTIKPFIISLLFVANPVLTEAVNAVSFREDLLCFLFYIGALILYLKSRANSFLKIEIENVNTRNIPSPHPNPLPSRESGNLRMAYFFSCLLYFLALLSKEMALTFPLVICCYEWIYRGNKNWLQSFLTPRNAGYLIITFLYIYLRFSIFQYPVEEAIPQWDIVDRLLTIPLLIINFLKLTLFPVSLSVVYNFSPIHSPFSTGFTLSSIVVISLIALAFIIKRREKVVTFGILFFFLTLIPVYNIIPLFNLLAERFLYIPSIGVAIVAGMIINSIAETQKSKLQNFQAVAVFVLIIATYSVGIITRNTVWRNGYSLWSDAVRKMPRSIASHNELGNAYLEKGQLDDAIREYRTALRMKPTTISYRFNLGKALQESGRLNEAVHVYSLALKLKPDYGEVHNSMGNIYISQGLIDKAVQEYKTASKLNPKDPIPHYNLGKVYHYQRGQLEEAVKEYLTVLRIDPNYIDAHYNLGSAYLTQMRLYEAIEEYQAALNLKPDHVSAHNNLGLAYFNAGLINEAILEYLTALRFDPNNADAHYNLGLAYNLMNLKYEARKEFEIALKLKPDFIAAKQGIDLIEKQEHF